MSSCHHVIMSSCHHVIMSSCHHVIMTLYAYINIPGGYLYEHETVCAAVDGSAIGTMRLGNIFQASRILEISGTNYDSQN